MTVQIKRNPCREDYFNYEDRTYYPCQKEKGHTGKHYHKVTEVFKW